MKKNVWMFLGALFLMVSMAQAGALMVNETTYDGSKVVKSTISVGDQSIRVDVEGEKGVNVIIYRGDKQAFWMINDNDKSYTEMTKKQMDDLAAQMEATMKQLPPAMRKMMAGKMGGAAEPGPKYVKKATGEKVGQWTTTRYEAADKKGVKKIWTTPQGSVQLTATDLAALKQFSKFFEKFGANKSDFFKFDRTDLGYTGVPVKTVMMEGAKVKMSSELKEATKKSFPASIFDVPAGYKKKDMKGM
jgi:hypothetical protein